MQQPPQQYQILPQKPNKSNNVSSQKHEKQSTITRYKQMNEIGNLRTTKKKETANKQKEKNLNKKKIIKISKYKWENRRKEILITFYFTRIKILAKNNNE